MTDELFCREELQHLLLIMNSASDPYCELCAGIRKKLEKMIGTEPEKSWFP